MDRPGLEFMEQARALEPASLEFDDPLRQSGFSGGRERWVKERSPLIEAIDRSGDFLDVGCANGLLAADVVDWTAQRGLEVIPHGVDLGPDLVSLAQRRLPSSRPTSMSPTPGPGIRRGNGPISMPCSISPRLNCDATGSGGCIDGSSRRAG